MWNISAEPMPSRISTPNVSFQRRYSSGGSASPAESTKRSDERSRAVPPGWLSMALIMVGTDVRIVGR